MLPGVFAPKLATRSERYRVTSLLGEGGFARVYRARPYRGTGEVAIKILNDPEPSDDVLARFADEARILGMAQDRALVSVEPMTRLGDRYAVVMEYVPGANCRQLVEQHGPLPARVVLQIVGEVARALDRVHHQPGPDGKPLGLMHGDLKPSNLQVTQRGEVKVLDFGGAKLEATEAVEVSRLHGTFGFIAPERLRGQESPAVDTYALGMVLYRLLTAQPTNRKQLAEVADRHRGARGFSLQLAAQMCSLEPADRPSLGEVVARCQNLIHRMDGPLLADWAPSHVPPQPERTDDPLCGTVIGASGPTTPSTPARNTAPGAAGRVWRMVLASTRRRLRYLPWVLAFAFAGVCLVAAGLALAPAVTAWQEHVEAQAPEPNGLEPTSGEVPVAAD